MVPILLFAKQDYPICVMNCTVSGLFYWFWAGGRERHEKIVIAGIWKALFPSIQYRFALANKSKKSYFSAYLIFVTFPIANIHKGKHVTYRRKEMI